MSDQKTKRAKAPAKAKATASGARKTAKAAAKAPVAKKPVAKKPVTKKSAAKKTSVKKPVAKKSAAQKPVAKKSAKPAAAGSKQRATAKTVKRTPRKAARYMDHDKEYSAEYLAGILKSVKTIAMVGASSDPTKFSYGVLRVLHETGYDMIPVNPKEAGGKIRGLPVYEKVQDIERPVDMVQVFRTSDALLGVAHDAIDIGAKVLWGQIGVRNDEAARLAEAAGLKVVMNRCPKIELFRPFWKPRLNQQI